MQKKTPVILLTFDVEEFDLPLEYDLPISPEDQFSKGKEGLDVITGWLAQNALLRTTLFTTANFALQYPGVIKSLSNNHEIASHSFYHTGFKKDDLLNSRLELERITGKPVQGLRMPRLKQIDMDWIREAGYQYDSSINPTTIPGRYNFRHMPRTTFREKDFVRLPTSVTPKLRLPLFWLAFKNLPYALYRKMALNTLKKDGYLSLYFHPWEFTDLSGYALPSYVKRLHGEALLSKFRVLINDLRNEGEFMCIKDFLTAENYIDSIN